MGASGPSQIKRLFSGGKKSAEVAREVLPWLVRFAEAGQTVTYGELSGRIRRHHRPLRWALGLIGDELKELEPSFSGIPPLQLIVVNKKSKIPGDAGLGWIMSKEEIQTLPQELKRRCWEGTKQKIFMWNRWGEVLRRFGLQPLPLSAQPLTEMEEEVEASARRGPESGDHRILKEFIATHPRVVGLSHTVPNGKTEKPVLSGDRLDVFFQFNNQWVCVEVKPKSSNSCDVLRGLYQCVKYRAVLEAERIFDNSGSRPHVRVILALGGELSNEQRAISEILDIEVKDHISPE